MKRTLRRVLPALLLIACIPTTARAEGTSVIYICVTERTVGWEDKDSGDVVGQFKPREDKMFVKWLPPSPDDGSPLTLPRIEVTNRASGTTTLIYADCDYTRSEIPRSLVDKYCRNIVETAARTNYGSMINSMSFIPDPSQRKPSIKFTSYLNLFVTAYLERGTCVLADP